MIFPTSRALHIVLIALSLPAVSLAAPIFSESFTEESIAALASTRFKPEEEDRWKGVEPEAVLDPDSPFAPSNGATGGSLRISSGSLAIPVQFPSGSFWLSFSMARLSNEGFPLLILRGKLSHHLLSLGDLHTDKTPGISASLSGAPEAEPLLASQPVSDPALVVVYFNADEETATLWINPPPGETAPSPDSAYLKFGPAAPDRPAHEKPPFASILLVAPGGTTALFDEIRIADSWQDLGL